MANYSHKLLELTQVITLDVVLLGIIRRERLGNVEVIR